MSQHSKLMNWVASSWRQDVATRGCCARPPVDKRSWLSSWVVVFLKFIGDMMSRQEVVAHDLLSPWHEPLICATWLVDMSHISSSYCDLLSATRGDALQVNERWRTCQGDMWDTTPWHVICETQLNHMCLTYERVLLCAYMKDSRCIHMDTWLLMSCCRVLQGV